MYAIRSYYDFRLKTDDATVLIDPFFTGNPSAPFGYEEIDACDLILLTHDHSDHIGQTLELAKKHKAEVVSMFDIIRHENIARGLARYRRHIDARQQRSYNFV